MDNYLYFLEVFVDTINFSWSNMKTLPKVKDVVVSVEVGKFLKMDVFSMYQDYAEDVEKNLKFNSGKSTLFSCSPENLLKQFEKNPLTIQVGITNKPLGAVKIDWPKDFIDLVHKSPQTYGVIGPVKITETFILKSLEDVIMGDIKTTIKLSSFGDTIQTNFQKLEAGEKRKFLIRGARGLTTFECQKYGKEGKSSDILPISTMYDQLSYDDKSGNAALPADYQPFDDNIGLSWMALFNTNLDYKESEAPDGFNMQFASLFGPPNAMQGRKGASTLTFDIVSIMERPEENKYLDVRIKASSKGFTIEIDRPQELELDLPAFEYRSVSAERLHHKSEDVNQKLTVEEINKLLCKHKDCPAARKFKEFGIGPLAKAQGLGTVYGNVAPPITYGLSQTYGVLDNYGPFGLYSRPKNPDDPFVPKSDDNWLSRCWKSKQKHTKKNKDDSRDGNPPLRLTGGGVLDYNDVKSPFYECREIMHQFDDILDKFKKAIGPCGKVTCPFAPNVVQESCKNTCEHPMDFKEEHPYQPPPELLNPSPTHSSAGKLAHKPACQSSKCVYSKYKSGLTQEDDFMELQYLPPPTSGLCGHPSCPYPVETELPPIHWDCPDPLPDGPCRNPNCPFLPPDLQYLNNMPQPDQRRTPCGNDGCPYALPESCSSPHCPFAEKTCPYQQPQQEIVECENPECPFRNMGGGDDCCNMGVANDICGNPDCPYRQYPGDQDEICGNPECPYAQDYNMQCQMEATASPCFLPQGGNPDCCFNMQQQDPRIGDPCNMPLSCPPDPCMMPYPVTIDLSCLQNILNCCLQVNNSCGKPDCQLGANEIIQVCFGGPTCRNNAPAPPCITEVQDDENKDVGPCGNPDCFFAKPNEETDTGTEVDHDRPPEGVRRYRPSLALDKKLEMHETAATEYKSDTRTDIDHAPCNTETCKTITDGKCQECGGPAGQVRAYRPSLALDKKIEMHEISPIEYKSDTRTDVDHAPCNTETCKTITNDKCQECGGPAGEVRAYRPSLALDKKIEMHEISPIEYKSDTRTDIDLAPCTQKTCKTIKDSPCLPCGGDTRQIKSETGPCQTKAKKQKKTKSAPEIGVRTKGKRSSKGKYVYSIGDKYPGIQIGHKECVIPSFNVPKTMGWLWNVFTPCMSLRPRRGWRPGGVPKSIAETIKKHRAKQGLKLLELKKFGKRRDYGAYDSGTSVNVQPRPTLQIKKKEGCYWITMNPLKDPFSLAENEDPYMDCTPMQFKITKNKNNVKVKGEDGEYKTCYCGDEDDEVCEEIESDSDSELDIEFTPPAGIIHPERFKKKKNVVHCDTQYLLADFEPPKPPSEKKDKKGKKGKKGKKDKKGKKGGKGKGKKGKKK